MTDHSWASLLHPGLAKTWFEAAPQSPFRPELLTFDRGNAWWLAELSRLVYRDDDRAAELARVGLDETWFLDRAGTQCNLVQPRAGEPFAVLAFRGSSELRDWLCNLRVLPRRWPRGGHVHRGFLRALLHVWAPLRRRLRVVQGPLFVTGHSLGGALATLVAAAVPCRAVYTFGAPHVGDAEFVATMQAPLWRVVHGKDLAPRLPPSVPRLQFAPAGQLCPLAGDAGEEDGEVPRANDRRWFEPRSFLADHAPVNYVTALRRSQ